MRLIDEFRDGRLGRELLGRLRARVEGKATLRLMEVCGTHTMSIFRTGLKSVLPKEIDLISGPGCPVCVTAQEDVDRAVELARQPDTIVITYGDMVKVPGTRSSLQAERARGADVRVVYSPSDALSVAQGNPLKRVVFLGVGFETTIPPIAVVIEEATRLRLDNFFVLSLHKLIPPVLRALLHGGDSAVDGFLLPGHVSAVIGCGPYQFLSSEYKIPAVISGFEPLDILQSVHMLVEQASECRVEVQNQYRRVVREEGNTLAQRIIDKVFEPTVAAWRGLGAIPASGLKLRERYDQFDAEKAFDIAVSDSREAAGCRCGEVLRGVRSPYECKLFAQSCTPDAPVGPCMVSSEGACAAHYLYGDWRPRGWVSGTTKSEKS